MDKSKKLLFVLGKYSQRSKNAIAATLAWITEKKGYLLEVYYDSYRSGRHYCGEPFRFKNNIIPEEDYFGGTVLGGFHHEQFYFLNNYFDVEYVLLNKNLLFESSIRSFGKTIINAGLDTPEVYQSLLEHFSLPCPQEATMVNSVISSQFRFGLDSLCYPDIFYSQTLGIDNSLSNRDLFKLKLMGIQKINCVLLPSDDIQRLEKNGFEINIIDSLKEDDNYKTITRRICKRWSDKAQQVALSDPVLASFWLPWYCRHRCISLFDFEVEKVIPDVISVASQKKQRVVFGRQNSDQDILALSKKNIAIQIIDPNRPPFSIMETVEYSWSKQEKSYYEDEPSDEQLKDYAKNGIVLGTILFHSGDLRHSDIIPRVFDFVAMNRLKIGVGITAQWYQYVPELLELINIPMESGGLFPHVEPLLYTGGLGIIAEGNGYVDIDVLINNLKESKQIIQKTCGLNNIPRGYYTFLDIQLRDWTKGRPELYEAIADLGFDYMICSLNPGESAVQYRKDRFVALNLSTPFFSFYSNFIRANDINEISLCEDRCIERKKPGWVIAALDSPIWGFEYAPWESGNKLKEIASYMTSGGNTGKLINVTPYTISRYARILNDQSFA